MPDEPLLSDLCSIWYVSSLRGGASRHLSLSLLLTRLATHKSPSIDAQDAKPRRARCRATNGISSEHRATASGTRPCM